MKRAIGFTFLTLIALGLIQILSPRLEAQSRIWNRDNQPRYGACFYMDEDYRGESFCMDADSSLQNVEDRYNDKISSVRVFGRARVIVYQDDNFGGARMTLDRDVSNLGDLNDKITAIQVSGVQYGSGSSGYEPRYGACFYMDEDYRGESFCMDAGSSLQNVEDRYNDKISSVRVFGRARVIVYQDDNFGGARMTLDRDVSNLGDLNDKITAIEVK